MTMKKIAFIIALTLTLLTSCKNDHKFTLNGDIKGISDTILVYYQSPYNSIDTIMAKNGRFEYSIPADTTTLFSLLLNNSKEVPVFAYRDGEANISGSLSSIAIEGEEDNMKMNEIFDMERKMKDDTTGIEKWIESFSKKYPGSFANVYLLNKYFIQREKPDYNRIKSILANLNGKVKDVPLIAEIQNVITDRGISNSTTIQSISLPDKNGKYPEWNALREKVTLLYFWASWDRESVEMQDSLAAMKKALSNKDFQIVGISLDIDKPHWNSRLPQDSVNWRQLCDFKGWQSNFIKQNKVSKIPYTILLDRKMNIIATDIYGKKLKDSIYQAIKKSDK